MRLSGQTTRRVIIVFWALALLRNGEARLSTQQVLLFDLEGQQVTPLQETDARVTVFLFTRTDCPISNRYAPEVQRLQAKFRPDNVRFLLIYPDPDESVQAIRKHIKEYGYQLDALRDPEPR